MNRGVKLAITFVLLGAAIYLSYLIYESIMTPIRFQKAYAYRSKVVQDKMLKIRDAEVAYLDKYEKYTADFDTLVNFIKNDSLIIIKSSGFVPDSIYNQSKTRKEAELKALELGIITRDTIKVSVYDQIFGDTPYDVDTLPYIPFTNLTEKFQLNAGTLKTLSKATRPVFEIKVHNNSFTEGLDRQQVINLNDAARDNDRFPGYIVGSMEEVSTSGNWD